MANEDHGPRIGADPELFVQDIATSRIVPVCGKVGGTKDAPLIIDHLIEARYGQEGPGRRRQPVAVGIEEKPFKYGNYAIQEDNVMLEFNVPAYLDYDHFHTSISKVMQVLELDVLPMRGLRIASGAMHTFTDKDLENLSQAFTIGCLPDMNAYAEEDRLEREPFSAAHFGNSRFCGGHIHVQYNHNNVPRHVFAQFMDLSACLPFLRWDKQKLRRMFYGQPGIYREKPYGIEYRTLSNFWVENTFRDQWMSVLLDNIYCLATTANKDPEFLKQLYGKIDWDDVQKAIKSEDHKMADDIIDYLRNKLAYRVGPPAHR